MVITAGIDVGSTYTKAVILDGNDQILGKVMKRTGFRLAEVSLEVYEEALAEAKVSRNEVQYVVATGFGRHQVPFKDVAVTDLTAAARGASRVFPNTRTILDVGGQTMKASRIDELGKVKSFRLNDRCAAGTGAFLEKTARYMGFSTDEIGVLATTSKEPVAISGVCAVFAESEVINHLSQGCAPADIMHGAMLSLIGRAVQLMRRVRMEPEYTLIGGILRFPTMATEIEKVLEGHVNLAEGDGPQFMAAQGAAILGRQRVRKLQSTT